MALEVSKETKFKISIETMVSLAVAISVATAFYIDLRASISEAMIKPDPVISRQEFDLKDTAIRAEVLNNRELIEKNFEKLEIIEQRLYELR
tara:strand:- start:1425 stop:1700 length:276 start_codon:yes stop_codon:yes gene_type:complete